MDSVVRVFAATVDGQMRSPGSIQQQLHKLHSALGKAGSDIRVAIKLESPHTTSEVEIQYALALQTIASLFISIDFKQALQDEYSLARSENAPAKMHPYGLVYIEPSRYNLFFSCVTAVAAAIAAGNCVIVELPKTLSPTSSLLQKILPAALDRNIFTITDKHIEEAALPKSMIRLHGPVGSTTPPAPFHLVAPTTRSVAIVDRGADMQQAASALLRARFSFGGRAPLAPSIVLVNEFRLKEFCNAVAEKMTKFLADQLESNGSSRPVSRPKTGPAKISAHELDQAGAEVLMAGSKGVVVRVTSRKSPLLTKQINEALMVIHPVRSIDDAIDLVNSESEEPLAALLVFAQPDVAKYAAQFVNAHLCCANNVPVELLVAPLTPVGFATSVEAPYTREMFSRPKPEYIQFGAKQSQLCTIIDSNDAVQASKMRQTAVSVDTEVHQPPGHAIGFFDQGVLLGAGVVLVSVVTGSLLLWKYGAPLIVHHIGHHR